MITSFEETQKLKAKIFLKYLIHAAKKNKYVSSKKPLSNVFSKNDLIKREIEKSNFLDKRTMNITDERIKELETKINIHYTQNKYLPYEERLKSLKKRLYSLKRKKDAKKAKINIILSKLKTCEVILKDIKSKDVNQVDI